MYCSQCGQPLSPADRFCASCGRQSAPPGQSIEQIEDSLRHVLPMATPFFALIAGYMGLFSVLLVPAPFAVIFGIIGLAQIKSRPHAYGKGRCWTGIILGLLSMIGYLLLIVTA